MYVWDQEGSENMKSTLVSNFFPHGLYFFIMLGKSKTEWMQQNENILSNFPCKSKHGPLSFI